MQSTARAPAAHTVLPHEIWEEIFLRLDAAADLARTSAACSSFRRIVYDRRFRSLHSTPVLGFISMAQYQFVPFEPPHRSAPEARALELAADFTFSFLPDPSAWSFCHALDGHVLLTRRISAAIAFEDFFFFRALAFEDFVVCDPVHHRYVNIPRIPNDVLASATDNGRTRHMCPILAPASENDKEESFRVICTVQLKGKIVVFIFSSWNQTWLGIISTICLPNELAENMPNYAHGCVLWLLDCMGYSLMLDTSEMEFSIIDLLPTDNHDSERAIIETEEGRLGLVTIGDDTIDLYCKNWPNNGVAAQDWQHEKLIPLPKYSRDYDWYIVGTAGHYVVVIACHRIRMHNKNFVLDIKTLLLEELCTLNNGVILYGFPYARFPPPLALPSI